MEHKLYKRGDPNIPSQLLDSNGDVALGMCKVCRAAECELTTDCPGERFSKEQSDLVCSGELDFRWGNWFYRNPMEDMKNQYWTETGEGVYSCRNHGTMFLLEKEVCLYCLVDNIYYPKKKETTFVKKEEKPPVAKKRPTQNEYFMDLAERAATRSNCYRRQVGCILIDRNNNLISTGYNGVPRRYPHCEIGECPRETPGKDLQKCLAIHAEMNALIRCPDPDKIWKAYVTHAPCLTCTVMLLNTNCDEIIYKEDYPETEEAKEIWRKQGRVISCSNPDVSN